LRAPSSAAQVFALLRTRRRGKDDESVPLVVGCFVDGVNVEAFLPYEE
jgi:hypothetical protein